MISNSERAISKRRLAVNLGRLTIILAVVGIVALGLLFKSYVDSVVNNRDDEEEYERYILPVVMMDPVPFDNINQMDMQVALQISMWDSLLGENRENFAYDENGMLLVPETDLDVSFTRLFGTEMTLIHNTFYDTDGTYLYDPDIKAYRVPMLTKISYTPYVESIIKESDKIVLKVGYIPPGNAMLTTRDKAKDQGNISADKYMFYDIYKNENGIFIGAIRDIDANAPAMS